VTGWLRFYRQDAEPLRVTLDLEGDFHEDIRGTMIRLHNPNPSDRAEALGWEGTFMKGFSEVQSGAVGDISAGLACLWSQEIADRLMQEHEREWDEEELSQAERDKARRELAEEYREYIKIGEPYHPHVPYPYIEWFSKDGRVVLELDESQVSVVEDGRFPQESARWKRYPSPYIREDDFISAVVGASGKKRTKKRRRRRR